MNYAGAGLILLSSDLTSVLLVRDTRSGKWGFPKGHREKDDSSDLATAVRECYEETGLVAEDYVVQDEVFKISKGGQAYLFRYAIMKGERRLRAGPAHEIGGLEWVSLQTLLGAQTIIDGNKYLRTWTTDIKASINKKSVNLFRNLLTRFGGSGPTQESVCASNIVTCA
jgi:8-oxo-dGTP pyrophosphatase MutT (NUDIX family)